MQTCGITTIGATLLFQDMPTLSNLAIVAWEQLPVIFGTKNGESPMVVTANTLTATSRRATRHTSDGALLLYRMSLNC